MPDLSDLIARVEAASGGDRELDVAIILALFPEAGPYNPHCTGDEPIFWNAPYYKQRCPHLTTSMDAVRSLLPPPTECWWSIEQLRSPDSPTAFFGPPGIYRAVVGFWKSTDHIARHDDPVLALLAAILKARQAAGGRHD
jgi:hypothetical protein